MIGGARGISVSCRWGTINEFIVEGFIDLLYEEPEGLQLMRQIFAGSLTTWVVRTDGLMPECTPPG